MCRLARLLAADRNSADLSKTPKSTSAPFCYTDVYNRRKLVRVQPEEEAPHESPDYRVQQAAQRHRRQQIENFTEQAVDAGFGEGLGLAGRTHLVGGCVQEAHEQPRDHAFVFEDELVVLGLFAEVQKNPHQDSEHVEIPLLQIDLEELHELRPVLRLAAEKFDAHLVLPVQNVPDDADRLVFEVTAR